MPNHFFPCPIALLASVNLLRNYLAICGESGLEILL
jgi:hypothetical protein